MHTFDYPHLAVGDFDKEGYVDFAVVAGEPLELHRGDGNYHFDKRVPDPLGKLPEHSLPSDTRGADVSPIRQSRSILAADC